MVRTDYELRKQAVLAAVINKYIKDPVPVASEDFTRDFSLSSATIRSIFAELEEAGYLTHPHTSAGRIPTGKGYRYYVDFLLSQIELLDGEKERIANGYRNEIKELESMLEKTSEVVSKITHYTSIVSLLDQQDKFFYRGVGFILDQPEFQDLKRMRFFLKMIEEKEALLDIINRDFKGKVKIYIGEELGCPEMDNCSLAVSSYSLKNQKEGRLAVLGPTRMEYDHIIPTLEYVSGILTEVLEDL